MDLTKSHNPNSIVLGSAKIEITKEPVEIDKTKKDWQLKDLVDLGLARGIKASFSSTQQEIKADNGTVPIKGAMDVKAKVEFSLLERDIPMLGIVMAGLVNVKEIKGKKTYTQEFVFTASYTGAGASGRLTVDKKEFEHKGKDYKITKIISQSGIKFNSGGSGGSGGSGATAIAIDLKVEDFKISLVDGTLEIINTNKLENANARYTISLEYEVDDGTVCHQLTKGSGGQAQPVAMKLTNKRKSQDGRLITRTFEFPFGHYVGDDSITLKSKNDADNVAEIPMAFEFTPHPDMADDNDLSVMSLYREIAEL